MFKPLENILVVALEQAVAAPFATSRLASAGARVIKIERAEGDFAREYDHVANGESAYFVWLNQGKESIAIDLKLNSDKTLLMRMLTSADVFIQNLAPGAASRAGFDSGELRVKYPQLITCDITGYGEQGRYRDMKAYDLLIQCEAGLASITGTPEGPGRVGVSVADIACGMNAHAAILQALYQREKTGLGAGINISLFDSLADWMAVPLMHFEYAGKAPERVGLNHPSIAPYGAYETGDDRQLVISIQNHREWLALCDFLQRPELADDARYANNVLRVANRTTLDSELAAAFASYQAQQLAHDLQQAGIAFGFVNGVDGLSAHPQLRRRTIETSAGKLSLPALPQRFVGDTERLLQVPALDEQGSAIRNEFS